MKGVKVQTNGTISMIDVRQNGKPLYDLMHEVVGGFYENVNPIRLRKGYVMVVNEEGFLLGLDRNPIGSYLYGTDKHGSPIVGDALILKYGFYEDEPDVVGMTDEEAVDIMNDLANLYAEMKGEK